MSDEILMMQAEIEKELEACVVLTNGLTYSEQVDIFRYQMGWEKGRAPNAGKRVRPLLLLLTINALGGDWRKALPGAAALELIHNYSLIHDDIEDHSELRRGKETIWVKWGQAQAINSGDAMLNLALLTPWKLETDYPITIVSEAVRCLQIWSLELTKGQYLDISFEKREDVSIDEYFDMVEGKTCSLLKAAFEMGGILGNVTQQNRELLVNCGGLLGRAYQVQDDWLGIWGNANETGKSNQIDLRERKKSYPILLGLEKKGKFASAWKREEMNEETIAYLANLLVEEGIKANCESEYNQLFTKTITALGELEGEKAGLAALTDFVRSLLGRKF